MEYKTFPLWGDGSHGLFGRLKTNMVVLSCVYSGARTEKRKVGSHPLL